MLPVPSQRARRERAVAIMVTAESRSGHPVRVVDLELIVVAAIATVAAVVALVIGMATLHCRCLL